jgi:GAF domain-containing protein
LALADARFSDALVDDGQVVWSDDAPNDPRFANSFFARFPHRSCAFIPLRAGTRVSGVLHLVWWAEPRRFTPAEIALLQAVGQQAAILLENARLLAAEARAQEVRGVTRLANAAAHEINNPLTVIVGHLQILRGQAEGAARHRLERILAAAARIGEIVERMRQITRLEDLDTSPNLPPMLDLRRSSEKDPPTS